MNATDFIKEHGVDKTREVVEGAPEWATYFDGYLYSEKWFHGNSVLISDIKSLIESVDLVTAWGGLTSSFSKLKYAEDHRNIYAANIIKQAIADYEQLFGNTETLGGEHV